MNTMFTPFEIQRRVLYYLEDSSQKPLIRTLINEAIQYVCQANEPGKDWSFLVKEEAVQTGVAIGQATHVFRLPSNVRSVINVSGADCDCELHGRDVIIKAHEGHTVPSTISIRYYTAQQPVYALTETTPGGIVVPWEYDSRGADAEWTASNPPREMLLLPEEALEVVVYRTLKLLSVHEIEVATNIQFLDQMVEAGLQILRSNYQVQIDYRTPVSTDGQGNQQENLTVGWLVSFGKTIVGGERSEYQMISLVNKCASDMADYLKLRGSQRPSTVNLMSDALPSFGAVSEHSMRTTATAAKQIPAQYWMEAMRFQCLRAIKQADELAVREYTDSLKNLSDLFYSLGTNGYYGNATYGDAMNHLRSIWKNQRSDEVLWSALNTCIANVMRAINTGETLTRHEFIATSEANETFDLPDDFKVAVKLTTESGKEIICRPFTSRGKTLPEQDMWQFPNERRPFKPNYFMIAGKKLLMHYPLQPGQKIELYYYPKHVWPYTTNQQGQRTGFDYSAVLPVDWDLLCLNLEARVALESGDGNKYGALKAEFNEAVMAHNEAQNRSLSEDSRMVAATPSVDYILACNKAVW